MRAHLVYGHISGSFHTNSQVLRSQNVEQQAEDRLKAEGY